MGTCYYLIRMDNRTGYDLGKAYGWNEVFGEDNIPMEVRPGDVDLLTEMLVTVCAKWGWDEDATPYLKEVAEDIIDWSEGKPFVFHSEHSGVVEGIVMEGWETLIGRDWITGDRHTPHMARLRAKRHAEKR